MLSSYTWTIGSEHQGKIEISDPGQNLGFACILHQVCKKMQFLYDFKTVGCFLVQLYQGSYVLPSLKDMSQMIVFL